jgi:hypothetical protein
LSYQIFGDKRSVIAENMDVGKEGFLSEKDIAGLVFYNEVQSFSSAYFLFLYIAVVSFMLLTSWYPTR